MSKLTHLCLGACGVLVLVAGIVWMPMGANAAPGDPQDGPSGPTTSSYGNPQGSNERYGNEQYNSGQYGYGENERYGTDEHEEYGNQGHQEEYGKEEYGNSRSCDVVHKIALGENLTTIAKSYGVSLEALIEENGIADANLIVENQALCIPEAEYGPSGEHGSYGERGSYGEENYGPSQEDSYEGMIPGIGYDPSTFKKEGGAEYGNQEYSNQEYSNQEYGNQGYREEEDSHEGYGAPQGSHEQESDVYHVPGKGYDPNESYAPQPQSQYEPQYNYPDREREAFDFNDNNPEDSSDPVETPEVPDTDPDNGNGG